MYGKILAAVAALTCGGSALLPAQAPAIRPSASVLFLRPAGGRPDSTRTTATYWKEGTLILGIPAGLVVGDFVYELCRDPDNGRQEHCGWKGLAGAALGFVTGAIPGALIGGQFKKGP